MLAAEDRALVAFLRREAPATPSLLARAELHGVPGLVDEALGARGPRQVARSLAHEKHLLLLGTVDEALAVAGIDAVSLKGALLAERFYPDPGARTTSDVDLLVAERDLERAVGALSRAGYTWSDDATERRFRRRHHHLHLTHADALPAELHFHAYRGFGRVLPSEPLVERAHRHGGFKRLRVLEAADELVYLGVHAAGHRFVRLGWLYDVARLLETMSDAEVAEARRRARTWGFGRVLAFAGELLVAWMGVPPERARLLGTTSLLRGAFVTSVTFEPETPLLRSATRFLFTALLCERPRDVARYVRERLLPT